MKMMKGLITLVAGFALAGIMASPLYAFNLSIHNPPQPAVDAGNQITYVITVSLVSLTGTSEDNIVVTDSLPRDLGGNLQVSYVTSTCLTPDGDTCNGPVLSTSAPDLTWTMPGQWHISDTFNITVTVNVDSNLTPTSIDDTANATGTEDPSEGVDGPVSATSVTSVAGANLTVSNAGSCNPSGKEALGGVTVGSPSEICSPTTVEGGETVGYTFDVTNTGSLDATGVVIQDVLPSALTLAATNANANSLCTAAGVPFPCCTGASAGTCNAPMVCKGPSECSSSAQCVALGGPQTCSGSKCVCTVNGSDATDCGLGGICFNGRCIACPYLPAQAGSFDTPLATPYVPATWLVPEIPVGQAVTVNYQATLASSTSTSVPLFNVATVSDAAGHIAEGTSNLTGAPGTPCLTATETALVTPSDSPALCAGATENTANSLCTGPSAPSACCSGPAAGTCGRLYPVPDDTITYTITVQNAANCPSTGAIEILAPLPNNTTYSTVTACTPGAGSCYFDGKDTVSYILPSLAQGSSATPVTFTVTVNPNTANGTAIQCIPGTSPCAPANATVNTTTAGGTAASIPVETVQLPILNVSKQVSPTVVDHGDSLVYSILVSNPGQNCAKLVQLIDALPAANLVAGSEVISGACATAGPAIVNSAGKMTLSSPFDLGSSTPCLITYTMVVPATAAVGTGITNTVTASGAHSISPATSNPATATVETELMGSSLTKTLTGCSCNPAVINNPAVCAPAAGGVGGTCVNWQNVPAPSTLTYTLQVTASPLGATNVQLTDNLPPINQATFVNTDCLTYVPPTPTTYLDCVIGTLPPNQRASFDIELAVSGANTSGTSIKNSATATDDASDTFNQALTVTDAVVVAVAAQASPAPAVQLGGSSEAKVAPHNRRLVAVTATVSNTGTADAHGVVVTGQVLGMRIYGRVQAAGLKPTACRTKASAGTFSCEVGALAKNSGIQTLTLPVLIPLKGTKQITTQLQATSTDNVPISPVTLTTTVQ